MGRANVKFYLRRIDRTGCGPWILCGRLEDMNQVGLRKGIDLDPYPRVFSIFVPPQETFYTDTGSWADILHIAWNRNSGTVLLIHSEISILLCMHTCIYMNACMFCLMHFII